MLTTKRLARIGALMLLVVFLMSSMATMACAATKTISYDCSGDYNGGETRTFYAKTGSTVASRKIDLTMQRGVLGGYVLGSIWRGVSVYGAYEIKVFYWNGSKWVQEQNYNAYNADEETIVLKKKNTYYRIQIYSWKSNTTFNSYWNNNVKTNSGVPGNRGFATVLNGYVDGASKNVFENRQWNKLPVCIATPRRGCTMYTSNPLL